MADTEEKPTTQTDFALSQVSQQYDRGNKGYLDPTEKQLRAMDSQNLGHLDINKVYKLMEDFKAEQQKAVTLRRVVIALSIFAVLLTLVNIGTSFAAARLAQQVKTTPESDFVDINTGERVNVNIPEDLIEIDVNGSVPSLLNQTQGNGTDGGRFLQGGNVIAGGDGNPGTRTPLTVSLNKVDRIFKDLCGKNWVGIRNYRGGALQCTRQGRASITYACADDDIRVGLSYKSRPQYINRNLVQVNLNGVRDGYYLGNVRFQCYPNVNPPIPCDIFGLDCSVLCRVQACGGGSVQWQCPEFSGCGCRPGSCPIRDQTCYSCYNNNPTTQRTLLDMVVEEDMSYPEDAPNYQD